MTEALFFDSYAFFEIVRGNVTYIPYKEFDIVTTKLNLFELYSGILKNGDELLAKQALDEFYEFAMDFDKEDIEEAAKLKIKLNRRKVSMTDCIGYCLASRLGIKFLTGDKEFEGMENVEFAK
jgi:predicted nucleic acid-binding protein